MSQALLQKRDQISVGLLTAIALLAMLAWWWSKGGATGRLINIDRAEPLGYRFLVDANQAEWPELAQLPEVGEVLAKRIVEYRQQHAPYQTPEDLLAVPGIGEKTLQRIRDYLLPLPGEDLTAGP